MCFRPSNVAKPQRCKACKAMNPPKKTECIKCGAEIEVIIEKIACPRCSAENLMTATSCSECGLTVEEAAKYM